MDNDGVTPLYRIVQSRQPRPFDFWSPERCGKPLRNPELRYMFSGVSMFGTLAAAAVKAATFPYLGQWIAEVDVTRSNDKYELFDSDGANLVGTYPTQEAALENVRWAVERYGEASMLTVGLGGEDEAGELVWIAHGEELIRLAFAQRTPAAALS